MKIKIICILIFTIFIGTLFNNTIYADYTSDIVTDFHDNLNGWTVEGDGTAIWKPCTGGYMKVFDVGDSIQVLAVSLRKFHGNWSNYYKISISLKRETPTNPDQSPWYYISGPGGSAQCHGNEKPAGSWMTCQVLLEESYWTVTSGLWDDLILNVASFKIDVELDDIGTEEIGVDNIILYSSGGGNHAPYAPMDPNPENHVINVDINTDLSWVGGDPDNGDFVKYDIYFEENNSNLDVLVSYHQSDDSFNPGTLNYKTKYYWKIIATDKYGAYTHSPIWDFTTISELNNPPNMPSNTYPENDAINIPTDIILNWFGGDPDILDIVSYDVYFGGMLPIQKIASNISNTSINPGHLVKGLTYFWNVVSWDNHGASTVGPSWHFTTINPDNRPPNKPNKPLGQIHCKIGQNYTYTTILTDPEADQLYCNWSWGDDSYSGWIGPYLNGETINQSHSWTNRGKYEIKVKAKDLLGMESDWSDPLAVSMPKSYNYNLIIQPFVIYFLYGQIENWDINESYNKEGNLTKVSFDCINLNFICFGHIDKFPWWIFLIKTNINERLTIPYLNDTLKFKGTFEDDFVCGFIVARPKI